MKQLELFKGVNKRGDQPQQRLATNCVVNSAYREVTNYMKPEGARYLAVTKVKGLSPEIINMSMAEAFHLAGGNILIPDRRRGDKNLTGSETMAQYQKERIGTLVNQSVPQKYNGVYVSKPIDGKVRQMALWESDQSILYAWQLRKPSRLKSRQAVPSGCGAKRQSSSQIEAFKT